MGIGRRIRMGVAVMAAVMLLLAGIGATLAYTTRVRTVDNRLSFGTVSTRLEQTTLGSDGEEHPVPANEPIGANTTSRITRVVNTGDQPVWVRARPDAAIIDETGETPITAEGYALDMGDDWADGGDGWWYYKPRLAPDETSSPATLRVTFTADTIGRAQGKQIRLDIESQAVQTENNADSAFEARGWPDTEGEQ